MSSTLIKNWTNGENIKRIERGIGEDRKTRGWREMKTERQTEYQADKKTHTNDKKRDM